MVLIGALAAGGGAFIAFLIPPPALFWMLEAIDQRWFSQPLLLVLPNGVSPRVCGLDDRRRVNSHR